MKNMLKAEQYRFLHSGVLWIVIAVLLLGSFMAILTGSYSSAEAALQNVFRDTAVLLLGSSVYGTIILTEDFSNGLFRRYIAGGYKRASIICAKFLFYIGGCCVLLFVYPLLSVVLTAAIRGIETSYFSMCFDFIRLFSKSLPLYLGIMGLFFFVSVLFQKAAAAMAVSVTLSIMLTVFPNMLYHSGMPFLKLTPMLQLGVISAGPISAAYFITALLSLCFLMLCLGGSILKINRDQF